MGAGSIRGSIITLSASACGSGVMVFPKLAMLNGLVLFLLCVILGAIGGLWSQYMLMQRARHTGIKTYA